MAGTKTEREPPNFVHQNAILCETIMKEQRHQKLYTNYSVNPFKKCKMFKLFYRKWIMVYMVAKYTDAIK
jgi:hypothetical protein